MTSILKEIINEAKILTISKKRYFSDERMELIILASELMQWDEVFTKILGPASKPAGVGPTEEDMKITSMYGGVATLQTLYRKDFEDYIVFAMLWPWSDHQNMTLHMCCVQKAEEQSDK